MSAPTVRTLKDIARDVDTAGRDLIDYYSGLHSLDETLAMIEKAAADLRAYIRAARS